MATRNSVTRLIPGNPLGSILRETAREARRTSRNTTGDADTVSQDDLAALQAQVDALQTQVNTLQAGHPTQYTAFLTTNGAGVISWTYPAPFSSAPFVFATPVSGSPHYFSLFNRTATGVQVFCWDNTSTAAPGIDFNLLAVGP